MTDLAPLDCTLLLAVDDKHLNELLTVYPTWALCHPEIVHFPIVLLYDRSSLAADDLRLFQLHQLCRQFGSDAAFTLIPWPPSGSSLSWRNHREKMLLAYVKGADYISTSWFLKIDTDAVATKKKRFIDPQWFSHDVAFISNPVFGPPRSAGLVRSPRAPTHPTLFESTPLPYIWWMPFASFW
jgi:hypothetical protein